ncbi:space blanket [Dermatophagoides pteronyssinus]|uniref:space blanket n=1 Tax=Dermatophagoides pteronyssinus TaxID=6956 RepID=UPI003F662724
MDVNIRLSLLFKIFRYTLMVITIIIILLNNQINSGLTSAFWTSNSRGSNSRSSNINSINNLGDTTRLRSSQHQQQHHSFYNQNQNNHYKSRDMQLEDILSQGEEKCLQKPCVQSEQCCPGSVCVDLHSHSSSSLSSMNNNKQRPVTTGTCLPIYGVNEGDSCTDDGDCETGLRCMPQTILIFNDDNDGRLLLPSSSSSSSSSSLQSSSIINSHQQHLHQLKNQQQRICQPPGQEMVKKQFNAECTTSSECDASHGLCCQLIKRHRMSSRKACLFFSEPKICLGPVDVTFARPANTFYYKPNERDYFRANIG